MNRKAAYALGILTLMLGVGCTKGNLAPSIPDNKVVDLASWVPEEMDGMLAVSSLEALDAAFEQMKKRSSVGQEVQEKLQETVKEETGLDLFSLATWREMGVNTKAPLMLSGAVQAEVVLVAVPVANQAQFLEAFEKNVVSKAEGEAQENMPEGLRAWELDAGSFVVVAQKPGYAIVVIGNDLEALQKMAQLSKEKSWSKHKDALLKTSSRLPKGRVASAWLRMDAEQMAEIEWLGWAMSMQPRTKMVLDVTWRQGQKPFLPKIQAVSFKPQEWPQGLGGAMGALWSSASWEWYTQLFKHPSLPQYMLSDMLKGLEALKQNLNAPVLLRGRVHTTEEDDEEFQWSMDALLKDKGSAQQVLGALLSLLEEEEEIKQPNASLPIWSTQLEDQEVSAQALGKNRVRVSNSLKSYESNTSDALQKAVMKEMMNYPVAMVFHLNALMKLSPLPFLFGDSSEKEAPEKAEYLLLGLRAEEGHAQLIGEHFVEANSK